MIEKPEVTIFDVAKYIFENWHRDYITQIELYKLLWFCQGWHYNVTGHPLFFEEFEAWDRGPVPRVLWDIHKGKVKLYERDFLTGKASRISGDSRIVVDKVIQHYGKFAQATLIYLSHRCDPWKEYHSHGRNNQQIPLEAIKDYFCKFIPMED